MNEKCLDMQQNSKSSEDKDAGCPFLNKSSQALFRDHTKANDATLQCEKKKGIRKEKFDPKPNMNRLKFMMLKTFEN